MAVAYLPMLILGAVIWYFLMPDERLRLLRGAIGFAQRGVFAAVRFAADSDGYGDALRARTRWVIITPLVIAIETAMLFYVAYQPGKLGDPATLIAWGANYGPRTTNGEWWRLMAALFVHASALQLVVNIVGFGQVGTVIERLVGPIAFALVYLAAGVLGSVASISASPIGVTSGASAAICGIYGLLVASITWNVLQPSPLRIPLTTLKRLAPGIAIFIVFHWITGGFAQADFVGAIVGAALGAAIEIDIGARKPLLPQLAVAGCSSLVIAFVVAVSVRGIIDVRPDLRQVAAIEARTAGEYDTAVARFRNGLIGAKNLIELIDDTIVPELRSMHDHLQSLHNVPPEHQTFIDDAVEYLRLRDESWRLRLEGLRTTNLTKLREAERVERASLAVLHKVRTFDSSQESAQ